MCLALPSACVNVLTQLPPAACLQDDYIDDTMDAENYESSFDEWGERASQMFRAAAQPPLHDVPAPGVLAHV